jgi:hypothetical membrane protein
MHLAIQGRPLPVRSVSAVCGMAAPLLFFLTAGILGMITPGYDPVTQLISELGETGAPYAWIMNLLGFGVTGVLILAFTPGLYAALGKTKVAGLGCGFVALAGVIFLAMAFVSCDRGCIPVTPEGSLHLLLGLLAAIAAVISSFLLAWPMRKRGPWHGIWQYSLVTGVVILLILPVFVSLGEIAGLLQRILVGAIFLWMEVLAIRVMTLR